MLWAATDARPDRKMRYGSRNSFGITGLIAIIVGTEIRHMEQAKGFCCWLAFAPSECTREPKQIIDRNP